MRVLLPPSEAKNPGGRGRSLGRSIAHPDLGAARAQVLAALGQLVAGPPDEAARALLLPPATVDAALRADATAATSATLPALRRYAGVVYEGLDAAGLDEAERHLAARRVLVFSGLLGVVRGTEAVPDYRVPAKATLPGIGVVSTFWRPVLDAAVPALCGRGLVVDLRSSDYTAMWRPRPDLARRVVTVRVVSPLPGGGTGVVSHPSKFAKGRLTAALVRAEAAGRTPRRAEDLADAWLADGGAGVDLVEPNRVVLRTG